MERPFVLSCRKVSETELGVYRRILDGARWKVAAGREYQTADVTEHVPGTRRAFFVKLPPGGSMHWHTDAGDCQTDHIVMTSNEGCSNDWLDESGTKSMHMLDGHRYSVDRTVMHAARNEGQTDRIHLLVEY
jgi:aspartyl/asparaginyl beta-hydroxylase (cupin superfamily)